MEKIRKAVEKIKEEFTFEEHFKRSHYYQSPKIWEKRDRFRVYVPRNAYEQAGWISPCDNDAWAEKKNNGGKYLGFYYLANRPGNVASLKRFIERVKEVN